MLNRVRNSTWGLILGLIGLYIALGVWLADEGTVEGWIYRVGLTTAAAVPLIFVGVYTWFGLHSARVAAKWWKTSLGSALVIAALSLVPIAWPLAWVFWFDHGELYQSWLAWVEVSGPCVSTLAWLRVCQLWLRVRKADSVQEKT
jgi:hypothetical protein